MLALHEIAGLVAIVVLMVANLAAAFAALVWLIDHA